MNRIFKVIWSKSKNCFVVTSELAKNHTGKTKRVTSRKLVKKTMAVTMAVMGLTQMTLPMVSAESNLDGSRLQIKGVQNGVSNVTTLSDTSLHMTGSGYSTDNVTGAPLAQGIQMTLIIHQLVWKQRQMDVKIPSKHRLVVLIFMIPAIVEMLIIPITVRKSQLQG
ncbi:MAG: ESPR domain-containing protein [Veillonellaceae bacterium]|nr:ESPR domain-containing protein [Veillonellaceae bacterium]